MLIAAIATVAGFIIAFACLLLMPHRKAPAKTVTRKLLVAGTPVVVATTHFWAECATGAVWLPPEGVKHLAPEWVDVAR
ncbi:MAG TPA: hypothetical protein VH083_08930, partial [Myxococcales bacterium]|nr:hypothetical protein [Myxococcales bacterium]